MVKITKPGGTQDPSKMFPYDTTLTCGKCGCEFRLEPGDAWKRNEDPYDASKWIQTRCPQPQCGAFVTWSYGGGTVGDCRSTVAPGFQSRSCARTC